MSADVQAAKERAEAYLSAEVMVGQRGGTMVEQVRLCRDVLALAARVEQLETALARAAYVSEHLFQMIDRETWLASGGDDGQGHYEGDYHAERVREEIAEWATLSVPAAGGQEDTPA